MNLDRIRASLVRRVGPLPLWAWAVIGGVGLWAGRAYMGRPIFSTGVDGAGDTGIAPDDTYPDVVPSSDGLAPTGPLSDAVYYGDGDPAPPAGPSEAERPPRNNREWVAAGVRLFPAAPSSAQQALSRYVSGQSISFSARRRFLDPTLRKWGPPPSPPRGGYARLPTRPPRRRPAPPPPKGRPPIPRPAPRTSPPRRKPNPPGRVGTPLPLPPSMGKGFEWGNSAFRVRWLQRFLRVPVTGTMNTTTNRALTAYRRSKGIPQPDIPRVDPATWLYIARDHRRRKGNYNLPR